MGEHDCKERQEHGQATEPRFEIKLPSQPADEVFASMLTDEDEKPGQGS